jgi:radical SAM protein with 4Fe4S-binding SPASM domain
MDVSLDSFGVLQVEPTDLCNLACRMCLPQLDRPGAVHGIPGGFMDPALFRRIFDDLAATDCHFDHVILQWMGDPALHPQLPELVGVAASRLLGRAQYLRVDTNGVLLDPDRIDALVDAWLPSRALPLLLVFSLDAVHPETYARVKGADQLARVRRNIRHLVDRRSRIPGDDVRLNLQLQFVLQEDNAHEVGEFVAYWERFLACRQGGSRGQRGYDEIMIKRLSVAAGGPGQAAADRLYDHATRAQGLRPRRGSPCAIELWEHRPWEHDDEQQQTVRGPCPGAWMTPVIRHDGQLTLCCVDVGGRIALGNLAEHGFRELWQGERADRIRMDHIQGQFHLHQPCGQCGGIAWYGFPHETARAWLASRDRLDLWPTYRQRMGL